MPPQLVCASLSEQPLNPAVSCIPMDGKATTAWKKMATVMKLPFCADKVRMLQSSCSPRVHRVAGLLKRWLLGTHQGSVSGNHLDYYLDEFTFRFNRRKSRSRGKLFYRLIEQALNVEPFPYHSMVGGKAHQADHNK